MATQIGCTARAGLDREPEVRLTLRDYAYGPPTSVDLAPFRLLPGIVGSYLAVALSQPVVRRRGVLPAVRQRGRRFNAYKRAVIFSRQHVKEAIGTLADVANALLQLAQHGG